MKWNHQKPFLFCFFEGYFPVRKWWEWLFGIKFDRVIYLGRRAVGSARYDNRYLVSFRVSHHPSIHCSCRSLYLSRRATASVAGSKKKKKRADDVSLHPLLSLTRSLIIVPQGKEETTKAQERHPHSEREIRTWIVCRWCSTTTTVSVSFPRRPVRVRWPQENLNLSLLCVFLFSFLLIRRVCGTRRFIRKWGGDLLAELLVDASLS